MFTTLLIVSGMTYLFEGRQKYVGSVALVKNERVSDMA
jgi:hypothetical protein